MRSFATTVEDSFNKAQARAKEINAALMLTTNGAASTVSSQFEMIRDNAGKERERTAAALQAAYDQANTQLAGIMNQTTERFKQSAADVRTMAGEIQRELEATRQELRRGVLELPQETSEQASAMRRVISDQIKALNELAGIVVEFRRRLRRLGSRRRAEARSAPARRTHAAPRRPRRCRIEPQPRAPEPPRVIELPARPSRCARSRSSARPKRRAPARADSRRRRRRPPQRAQIGLAVRSAVARLARRAAGAAAPPPTARPPTRSTPSRSASPI